MKILGIDPALASLGYGVIINQPPKITYLTSGTIITKPSQLMHKRLAIICEEIEGLIDLHKPDAIAMEETFINNNPTTSLKLGYVRGAIMALIGRYDIPFFEYKPNLIKKTVVGVGHAEKEQIIHMVKIILSGAHTTELKSDAADALAVAYTCLVHSQR
jgi:crossover junction endodeoxyribonuclease RuvC